MPSEIIETAKAKSIEFEKNLNLKEKVKTMKTFENIIDKLAFYETIMDDEDLLEENMDGLLYELTGLIESINLKKI